MPLKRKGRVIYHKVGGKWTVKQRCKSVENAKKALRLLQGVSHGWKPNGWRGQSLRHKIAAHKGKHKKSYASIEGNMIKIEDLYYALDQEGINVNQLARPVTDHDVFKKKNDYYYRIKIPVKGRAPLIFNTYSGDKDIAHRYVKAIRMVQARSGSTGYLQGLYRPRGLTLGSWGKRWDE